MARHLSRSERLRCLRESLARFPVVALLGARQVGKSTLARDLASGRKQVAFLDLESGRSPATAPHQTPRS